MLYVSFIKYFQVFESQLLEIHQHTGYHLLVVYCLRLQAVGHNVVDVLDKNDVRLLRSGSSSIFAQNCSITITSSIIKKKVELKVTDLCYIKNY